MNICMYSLYKIVVFDFDGVVCDSTDECMVTSWNAWEKWESRKAFRHSIEDFSINEKSSFRQMRPRVRGAGEYYIICRALNEGIIIDNQLTYDNLIKEWHDFLEPFKKIFFEMRELLRNKDIDEWVKLHPIYDNIITIMKNLQLHNQLYIATLKDKKSVQAILNKNGMNIEENQILDQSQITSKIEAMDKIRSINKCNKSDMVLIDDNVTHLLQPHLNGYDSFQTSWGNVPKEYLAIANNYGIEVISKENLRDRMKLIE